MVEIVVFLHKLFVMTRYSRLSSFAIAAIALISCNKGRQVTAPTAGVVPEQKHSTQRIASATVLGAPVAEAKLYKLLPGYSSGDNFEASGVYSLGSYFYIACDNMQKITKIKSTLPINSSSNSLLSTGAPGSGSSNFEGITYDNNGTVNFFTVEESAQNGSVYQPRIYEYDASMNYQRRSWANYNFTSSNNNKAFEGITWVYRGGNDYLLGIVESTGVIAVLRKTSGNCVLDATITLPSSVTFSDYSDICVYGNKIAILSQQDCQFWIGTLSSTSWTITGGTAYEFPKGSSGGVVGAGTNVLYANAEGISFINDNQVVVVSDKADNSQPSYQSYKDQSVAIFNIP